MAKRTFLTLSADLQSHANRVADELGRRGYTIRVEQRELAYPFTPTLVARRAQTTRVVVVDSEVRLERLEAWSRYGRSSAKDTQVVVAVPEGHLPLAAAENRLRELRIGLLSVGPTAMVERIAPVDLAINIQAPALGTLPPKTNRRLAQAIEKVDRGEWRDGFKDACEVLEVEARRHLREGLRHPMPRIVLKTATGKRHNLAIGRIRRLTMGQLADVYRLIQRPNHADDLALRVMDRVKKDRNAVTHHSREESTERRLRRNAGRHIWSIANAVQALMGE